MGIKSYDDSNTNNKKNYINNNLIKKSLILASIMMLLSIIIGISIGGGSNEINNWISNQVLELSWKDIFIHNLKSNIINLLGIVTVGLVTLIHIYSNGLILGITLSEIPIETILNDVLKHGILEILGMLLFSTIGLLPVIIIFDMLSGKKVELNNKLLISIIHLIFISILCLLLAALIEGNTLSHK